MRAVNAYLNINNNLNCAFKDGRDVDILIWKLSLIRNKKLSFKTVLYTTEDDKAYLEHHDLLRFYDEVHYIDKQNSKLELIDLKTFWAAIKFVAIEEELKQPEPFFIVDTDLVFMDNSIISKIYLPNLLWANTEPAENYPPLATLAVPEGFKYPRYIDVTTRPVNTAIIKINNRQILEDWIKLAWRFMIGNPLPEVSSSFGLIVTVEQRFLANVIRNKYKEDISFYCDGWQIENFGKEHFHTWGAKNYINTFEPLAKSWTKSLLLMIKQEDPEVYNDIITHPTSNIQAVLEDWDNIKIVGHLYKYIKEN